MRFSILASVLSLLALGAMVASPGPATAAKSKMGCDTETEMWNAAAGKCEPGARKYKRKSADQPAETGHVAPIRSERVDERACDDDAVGAGPCDRPDVGRPADAEPDRDRDGAYGLDVAHEASHG